MRNPEIVSLLQKLLDNSLDARGLKRLRQLAKDPGNDQLVDEYIEEVMIRQQPVSQYPNDKHELLQEIMEKIEDEEKQHKTIAVPLYRQKWIYYAACILLFAAAGIYYWNSMSPQEKINEERISQIQDVAAPVNAKVRLTLSNGHVLYIDSVNNGMLAVENNTEIIKLADGQLVYNVLANDNNKYGLKYNTLEIARGSKPASIVLPDKSKIWLNTGSSIKYPVEFTGKERFVEITGEAYFEIANNKSQPFVVKKKDGNTSVQVLGTRFNVNAYEDEPSVNITLVDGSVRVQSGEQSVLMQPRQQAQITGHIHVKNNVNTDEAIAWKNDKFQFEALDITSIMRQLARAYDLEIEYKDTVKETFGGTIARDVSLSQVLKMFELTGMVKFKITGNKIVVMSGKK